jgi:SAM-dependent methyltransferase
MKVSGERYFPRVGSGVFAPYEPFVSYEHWHRYCYALPFVTGKSVLDIASGEGYGSAFLAQSAALVYGLDISEEAVQHARENYVRDNLHFLHGAADAIPIPGEQCFDVIVSFETIEHLDAPTQERFAAEVTRLLKPDGVFLVSTPNRTTYSPDGHQGNPYHLHEFTRDEFVAFLHQRFARVRVLSQHVYPISYIWNADGRSGPLVECQICFDGSRFQPRADDGKEIGYLIAVCSQRDEVAASASSLLIDLSETAFRGLPGLGRRQMSTLFLDTGSGFRPEETVQEEAEYQPEFTLRFTLDPTRSIRELRWDPLETRLCRVRLRQVRWQDGEGLISQLDLGRVTSNGTQGGEATFEFDTPDPVIWLPISGSVASVTIEGECIVADESSTFVGLQRTLMSYRDRLAQQDRELQAARQQITAHEQSILSYRHQLAQQDQELQASWREHAAHERKITALTSQLEDREGQIGRFKQRVGALEQREARLEAALRAILNSKRWILINGVRSALFYLPQLLRSTWKRAQREPQRDKAPSAVDPLPRPSRQGRHAQSSQETLT